MFKFSDLQASVKTFEKIKAKSILNKYVRANTPVYTIGQSQQIQTNNFSFGKAIEKLGFVEAEPEAEDFGDIFMTSSSVMGVSNPRTKRFAINPFAKVWETTALHEVGHLFLNHQINMFDTIFGAVGKQETNEVEAGVFSILAAEKLKLDFPRKAIEWQVSKFYGLLKESEAQVDVMFTQDNFRKVQKAVREFLEIGR